MSRRRPLTQQRMDEIARSIVVVCDQDPRPNSNRVCKIQTFLRDQEWVAKFPQFVAVRDRTTYHVFKCKLCQQHVTVTADKLYPILDRLLSSDVHQITINGLRYAISEVAKT